MMVRYTWFDLDGRGDLDLIDKMMSTVRWPRPRLRHGVPSHVIDASSSHSLSTPR